MNKGTLKTILYILLGLIIFSVVMRLFFSLLPYLIGGGLVIWLIVKIYGFLRSKSDGKDKCGPFTETTYSNREEYVDDSFNHGEVIDVDYKDVNE